MAKLLPPIVEGTIPAFYSVNEMVNITIPFTMNRAVSKTAIKGIAIKIKTLQSSSTLGDVIQETVNYNIGNECSVSFSVSNEYFNVRQFYKFQIAYIGIDNMIGYYSSVAIGKYTSQPEIYIDGLDEGIVNYHSHAYSGIYRNDDYTENVYSYRFDLTDSQGITKFTTGDLIHNSLNDDELTTSIDLCEISQDLGEGNFYLQYSVVTTNNLYLSTDKYKLQKSFNIDMDVKQPILTAVSDNDNGCISLSFTSGLTTPQNINANFVLYRSDENGNFLNWEECYYFSLNDNYINKINFWQDYTVEHKKQYKYAIAQFNENNLYSGKVESNVDSEGESHPISIDFEDIYLYDSTKRLLKIKYNPKVASFKNNLMETKIETIGKQHPFILRNGIVSYKEFPISGLITHLMDTNINNNLYRQTTEAPFYDSQNRAPGKFDINKVYVKNSDNKYILFTEKIYNQATVYENCYIYKPEINALSTDLTSDNIYKERQFKLDVLAWLTNGEPKLFRSPTEGNYIVRLLNVSLTPLDQLGRMLHSFNCTAYEIAEPTYENMNTFGILGSSDIQDETILQWKTVELSKLNYSDYLNSNNKNLLSQLATTIRCYDMTPGQMISVTFSNGITQKIIIGTTGMYRLENTEYEITKIELEQNIEKKYKGYITYSYKEAVMNDFKEFNDIEMLTVPDQQFIGEHNIIKDLLEIDGIKNSKINLIAIPRIKFYQRPIKVLRKVGENIYYQHNGIDETIISKDELNNYCLYVIIEKNQDNIQKVISFSEYRNDKFIPLRDWDIEDIQEFEKTIFDIYIGNSKISLQDKYEYTYISESLTPYKVGNSLQLKVGPGIITEMSYILKSQTYILESNEIYDIKMKKDIYLDDIIQLENIYQLLPSKVYDEYGNQSEKDSWIDDKGNFDAEGWENDITYQRKYINEHYNDYILTLEKERYRSQIIEGILNIDEE